MSITATPTAISDVLIIEPKVFSDDRGYFFESFNEKDFAVAIGRQITFVQDNYSLSKKGVIRGLHYQNQQVQSKLVSVTSGCIFDVAVDLRRSSLTYGQWVGVELSADNHLQHWIPEGFSHGFLVLSDYAEVQYKTTNYWHPASEQCIAWNDPKLNIQWPDMDAEPILSAKDLQGLSWAQAPKFD